MKRLATIRTSTVIQNRLERHGFGIGGAAGLGALDGRGVRGGGGACEAISGEKNRVLVWGGPPPPRGNFRPGGGGTATPGVGAPAPGRRSPPSRPGGAP